MGQRRFATLGIDASGVALVVSIALLVLSQGGYFSLLPCFVGIVDWLLALVLVLAKRRRLGRASVPLAFLGALVVAYVASALAISGTSTSVAEAGVWVAAAGAGLLAWLQTEASRKATLSALGWFGVITAAMAFAVQCHVLPVSGGYVDGRLQFTFQYANAAAVWFGAVAFLSFFAGGTRLKSLVPLSVAAMLFCLSGGGTLVFLLVAIGVSGLLWRHDCKEDVFALALQLLFGLALFLPVKLVDGPAGLLVLVVGAACCMLSARKPFSKVRSKVGTVASSETGTSKGLIIAAGAAIALAVAAAVALAVLFWPRLSQAVGTFAIRLVYDCDAVALALTNPFLGVGPDMWRYLYPLVQSAQYEVAVVHCSYLQTLVDAGLLGLALLAAFLATGIAGLVKAARQGGEVAAQLAVVALILVHSLVDFDLQFGALLFLMAVMMVRPSLKEREGAKAKRGECAASGSKTSAAPGSLCSEAPGSQTSAASGSQWIKALPLGLCCVAGLCLCFIGAGQASVQDKLEEAVESGSFSSVVSIYASSSFSMSDPRCQDLYLDACYRAGRYEELVGFDRVEGATTASQALLVCQGYSCLGQERAGQTALLDVLEAQPYNVRLYREAYGLLSEEQADEDVARRFNALVDVANEAFANQSFLAMERGQTLSCRL